MSSISTRDAARSGARISGAVLSVAALAFSVAGATAQAAAYPTEPRSCEGSKITIMFQPEKQRKRKLYACSITPAAAIDVDDTLLSAGRRYHGIWDADRSRWAVPPRFDGVRYFNDDVVYARNPDEAVWRLQSRRSGQVDVVYGFRYPDNAPDGGRPSGIMAFTDAERTRAVMFDRNGRSGDEIRDIDPEPLKTEEGFTIDPFYAGAEAGGVIVRHRREGEHFYQAYNDKAEPISPRYPVAETQLSLMLHLKYGQSRQEDKQQDKYVFVHKREDGTLWPLLVGGNQFAQPHETSRGIDGYVIDAGSASAPQRVRLIYQRFEKDGETRWLSLHGAIPLIPSLFMGRTSADVVDWRIIESPEIPLGGRAFIEARAPGRYMLLTDKSTPFPGVIGGKSFDSVAGAEKALAQADASIADQRKADQLALQQRLRAADSERQAKAEAQQNLFALIDQAGPNPVNLSTYGYETEYYCALRGRRCEEYRSQYQQWQNSHNSKVAAANRERLQKVYQEQIDLNAVRASTECFRRASESKAKEVSGQQNWHYSSKGCKPTQ